MRIVFHSVAVFQLEYIVTLFQHSVNVRISEAFLRRKWKLRRRTANRSTSYNQNAVRHCDEILRAGGVRHHVSMASIGYRNYHFPTMSRLVSSEFRQIFEIIFFLLGDRKSVHSSPCSSSDSSTSLPGVLGYCRSRGSSGSAYS